MFGLFMAYCIFKVMVFIAVAVIVGAWVYTDRQAKKDRNYHH